MHKYIIAFVLILLQQCLWAQNNRTADSLRHVIQNSQNESDKAYAKVLLADELLPAKLDSARLLLEKASALTYDPSAFRVAEYHTKWGLYYWYSRDYELAIDAFRRVLPLGETTEMLPKLAEANNNMGALYSMLGQNDSARVRLTEAIRIDELRGNLTGLAKTNYDLGVLYRRQSQFELALQYLLLSVDYHEKIQDSSRLLHSLTSLASVYADLNETQKSIEARNRAQAIAEAKHDTAQMIVVYNNQAAFYSRRDFDKTMAFAEKGLELIRLYDHNNSSKVLYYTNIAAAFMHEHQYEKALPYLYQATSNLHLLRKPYAIAGVYTNMGRCHFAHQQWDSAQYYFQKAIEIARPANVLSYQSTSFLRLSSIDSAQGNYRQALARYQEGIALRDSMWNNEKNNRIAELQILYETEKREAEKQALVTSNALKERVIYNQRMLILWGILAILLFVMLIVSRIRSHRKLATAHRSLIAKNEEILAKQEEINQYNRELLKQKQELLALNQTKDKFFSVIAHDLRAPFSGLINLLELIVGEFEDMSSEEKKSMLQTMLRSSQNTYNLLVNLLDWSRAQQGLLSNKPSEISIALPLQEALDLLSSRTQEKQHTIVNHISEKQIAYCDPDIVKSVFINLINNAIKFTPRHGLIEIFSNEKAGMHTISVRDNGIGIPENKLDQLFDMDTEIKRKGTDNELGTGLGLIMVKDFVHMMNGTIEVVSTEGAGSTFTFSVPAKKPIHT